MKRYFFDIRDGNTLLVDEDGSEFGSMEAVREEAALSLADMARDNLRKRYHHQLQYFAIEVRDKDGPVLHAKFAFELDPRVSKSDSIGPVSQWPN